MDQFSLQALLQCFLVFYLVNLTQLVRSQCTAGDTSCKIKCNGHRACRSITLNCPDTTSCQYCELLCNGQQSCSRATLNGHYCSFVNVTIAGTENSAASYITINAPGNNGDLYVGSTSTSSSRWNLYDAEIISSNDDGGTGNGGTNNMIVNCHDSTDNNGECDGIDVDGTYANYLEFNCPTDTYCYGDIICPINSNLQPRLHDQIEALRTVSKRGRGSRTPNSNSIVRTRLNTWSAEPSS